MKPKMGRPKLPKGETKGVLIGARFSPDEAKQVELAVEKLQQNKSKWVRNTLLIAAKSV